MPASPDLVAGGFFIFPSAFSFFPGLPALGKLGVMTGRQFYDWQTAGGADDVMRMVDALERAEIALVRDRRHCGEPLGRRTDGDPGCRFCCSS